MGRNGKCVRLHSVIMSLKGGGGANSENGPLQIKLVSYYMVTNREFYEHVDVSTHGPLGGYMVS